MGDSKLNRKKMKPVEKKDAASASVASSPLSPRRGGEEGCKERHVNGRSTHRREIYPHGVRKNTGEGANSMKIEEVEKRFDENRR
jgi:hypothetical protein